MNSWLEYVKEFRNRHPDLSYKESLVEASKSYQKLKMKGGFNNIDLTNSQMRYEAGVKALNSGLADINRPIQFK
jgi:hypothetical protein